MNTTRPMAMNDVSVASMSVKGAREQETVFAAVSNTLHSLGLCHSVVEDIFNTLSPVMQGITEPASPPPTGLIADADRASELSRLLCEKLKHLASLIGHVDK